MLRTGKLRIASSQAKYATPADFCQVIEAEIKSLYLLAFLLTSNHEDAEKCFVSTVDLAFREPAVFKRWVLSWIKRTLIKNAIQIVLHGSRRHMRERDAWSVERYGIPGGVEIDAVTRLAPMERFIFVMSVLERYSIWECSLLLGCDMKEVVQIRTRALCAFPAAEISPKRVRRPDEMAQAAVFLSSDKPSFVTGVAMAADVRKAS